LVSKTIELKAQIQLIDPPQASSHRANHHPMIDTLPTGRHNSTAVLTRFSFLGQQFITTSPWQIMLVCSYMHLLLSCNHMSTSCQISCELPIVNSLCPFPKLLNYSISMSSSSSSRDNSTWQMSPLQKSTVVDRSLCPELKRDDTESTKNRSRMSVVTSNYLSSQFHAMPW